MEELRGDKPATTTTTAVRVSSSYHDLGLSPLHCSILASSELPHEHKDWITCEEMFEPRPFVLPTHYNGTNTQSDIDQAELRLAQLLAARAIPWSAVARHNRLEDAWLVIENHVYDVTAYLLSHPGGTKLLLPFLGRDATSAFTQV
jgi:cytochrome b involved in lipid metabolism